MSLRHAGLATATVICALTFALATCAGEATIESIDPSLVQGTTLLLPDISGSIDLPAPDFSWNLAHDGDRISKTYLAANETTGERYVVKIVPVATTGIQPPPEFTNAVERGVRKSVTQQGAKILSESKESLDVPSIGSITGYRFTVQMPNGTINMLSYYIGTGKHCVVVSAYPPDGKPSPNLSKLIASLKFQAVTPASGITAGSRSLSSGSPCLGYLLIGGLLGALVQLIAKYGFNADVNGANLAIGIVLIIMLARIGLIVAADVQNAPYRSGQELGTALFPLIIFAFMSSQHKKKQAQSKGNSLR